MTAINCIIIGIVTVIFGFSLGIFGSLMFKKYSVQEKFISLGGYLVGAGIIVAILAWIYYIGTILM